MGSKEIEQALIHAVLTEDESTFTATAMSCTPDIWLQAAQNALRQLQSGNYSFEQQRWFSYALGRLSESLRCSGA